MKDELKPIVQGLVKKSLEDKVAWVHASAVSRLNEEAEIPTGAEDYAVSTSSYTINLFRITDVTPESHKMVIRINILNEVGDVVTSDAVAEDEEEYGMMENLLNLARKAALGEERVLK